jgi:hypothetical protein
MSSHTDDGYQDYQRLADVQLRFVREYSPNTCAVLEKLRPYGAKAVFQSAYAVERYKALLECTGGVPEKFDYYSYVQDYPEVVPLLDQAITCLLEDWLCGNVKHK